MNKALTLVLLFITSAGFSQTVISGKIKPSEKFDSKLYILKLNQIDPDPYVVYDSIQISATGNFSYTFKNTNPQDLIYKIFLPVKEGNRFSSFDTVEKNFFFITTEGNEKINITADADSLYYSVKIARSGINKTILTYRDIRTPIYNLEKMLTDSIKLHPENEMEYKRRAMPLWMEHVEKARLKYSSILDTTKNTSMVLLGILNLFESNLGRIDSVTTTKYLSRISNQDLLIVRNLKKLTSKKQFGRIGLLLPDVTLHTVNGNKKQLYDFKSDYLVLDFWASWCGPCRHSNKNELPQLYSKYKGKVSLNGITIDEDLSKWKKAVSTDNTAWEQYIDKQYTLQKMLNAYAVPVYLILDREFKVIYETMSAYELGLQLDKLVK